MNIINISSVLMETKEEISNDKILQEKIKEYITIYTGITIIESKIAYNPAPFIYINLYTERENVKEKIQIDIEKMSKETI
jgi:hypothetical protein